MVKPPEGSFEDLDPKAAWERVLATYVDRDGVINFEGMAAEPRDLNAYVAWLARPLDDQLGPSERLAWLCNAYNGLAMYNVLHSGVLPASKIRFFYLRELQFNGERTCLYNFENDVIRPLGDPRIHFWLNCMVRSCPRLPREPLCSETLDRQLTEAAREFLQDPRYVYLDGEKREVHLSAILDWYQADFLAEAPSLLGYINLYRSEPVPLDWDVRFLPYDWTLNAKP